MKTTEVSFAQVLKSGTLLGLAFGSLYEGILPRGPRSEWQEAWHICSWLIALYGLMVLWNALTNSYTPRSGKSFFGSFLVGWGLYLVLMHALLFLLRRPLQTAGTEFVFLLLGLAMSAVGHVIVRRARRSFYHRILTTIRAQDVLTRPPCPPPFS